MKKYNKFSISKAIDKMDDFGWCPLCLEPAEIDKIKNMGQCCVCSYIFCTLC